MRQELLMPLIEILQGIAHNLPIHQVLRVEDGQSRRTMETRGRHIIILPAGAYAHVGVGVVSIDYRIGICPVAIIGTPHLRTVLS